MQTAQAATLPNLLDIAACTSMRQRWPSAKHRCPPALQHNRRPQPVPAAAVGRRGTLLGRLKKAVGMRSTRVADASWVSSPPPAARGSRWTRVGINPCLAICTPAAAVQAAGQASRAHAAGGGSNTHSVPSAQHKVGEINEAAFDAAVAASKSGASRYHEPGTPRTSGQVVVLISADREQHAAPAAGTAAMHVAPEP